MTWILIKPWEDVRARFNSSGTCSALFEQFSPLCDDGSDIFEFDFSQFQIRQFFNNFLCQTQFREHVFRVQLSTQNWNQKQNFLLVYDSFFLSFTLPRRVSFSFRSFSFFLLFSVSLTFPLFCFYFHTMKWKLESITEFRLFFFFVLEMKEKILLEIFNAGAVRVRKKEKESVFVYFVWSFGSGSIQYHWRSNATMPMWIFYEIFLHKFCRWRRGINKAQRNSQKNISNSYRTRRRRRRRRNKQKRSRALMPWPVLNDPDVCEHNI